MKNKILFLLISCAAWAIMSTHSSCTHDTLIMSDDEMMPVDTTEMPIDTTEMPVDTSDMTGTPCDPEVVYFATDVLPILISNCAFSGCHSAASAQDGVILTDYANVIETADVEAFDLGDSELYEVITEDDADDIMPPPPNNPLTQAQIQTISAWILQGAQNLTCDPDAEGCDTENVSFAATIQPVLQSNCTGCHGGGSPSAGIDLTGYAGVKTVADDGRLYGSIAWQPGFSPMPQGGAQLSECAIAQFESWIEAGALNN